MPLPTLPSLRRITADSAGVGFFLCTTKEVRPGRNGDFLSLTLQDATGRIQARVFDEVDRLKGEFEAGEFVKVKGRANLYNERIQLIVENIRRVHADQDRIDGFREEDCVMSSARPIDVMWAELQQRIAGAANPYVRQLLERIARDHETQLRVWPAAQTLHHAYRAGFLEHVLQMAEVGRLLATAYEANADLVLAGALLHDIGKLQELDYDLATSYSREGRLLGHIMLGARLIRETAATLDGFPPLLLTEIEHLVLSHHGCLEFGSPVVPMTVEAFILSFIDDLDAKINMVRGAIRDDTGDGEFTGYHSKLARVFWKGAKE
ncbi:MAG TPA: HD domain-containing protein [Vicinamibacterales bacterium]|jgi:3'-5' exoribonuclease